MSYLSLPGVDLWHEDTGGPGAPVVFLHAASGTAENWMHQLPAFTSAGYRCITYDRRTWGRSKATDPEHQPGYAGDDLHALVESLSLERFPSGRHCGGRDQCYRLRPDPPGAGPQPGCRQHHRRRTG